MAEVANKETKTAEPGKEIQKAKPAQVPGPFEDIERMYDRWFENFFSRNWLQPFRREWPSWSEMSIPAESRMPKVDVIDRDDEVVVRAEIPGVVKENLEVNVSDNVLTIKAETKREKKEEKGDYYRCEISRGSFARTLSLPHYVDHEKAKANFKDGVLELTLPKLEKVKRRNIKID